MPLLCPQTLYNTPTCTLSWRLASHFRGNDEKSHPLCSRQCLRLTDTSPLLSWFCHSWAVYEDPAPSPQLSDTPLTSFPLPFAPSSLSESSFPSAYKHLKQAKKEKHVKLSPDFTLPTSYGSSASVYNKIPARVGHTLPPFSVEPALFGFHPQRWSHSWQGHQWPSFLTWSVPSPHLAAVLSSMSHSRLHFWTHSLHLAPRTPHSTGFHSASWVFILNLLWGILLPGPYFCMSHPSDLSLSTFRPLMTLAPKLMPPVVALLWTPNSFIWQHTQHLHVDTESASLT